MLFVSAKVSTGIAAAGPARKRKHVLNMVAQMDKEGRQLYKHVCTKWRQNALKEFQFPTLQD